MSRAASRLIRVLLSLLTDEDIPEEQLLGSKHLKKALVHTMAIKNANVTLQQAQRTVTNIHLNWDEVNARIAEIESKSLLIQRLNTGWLSRQIGLGSKPDHPKPSGRTNLPRYSINHCTTIIHYIKTINSSAIPAHDTFSGGLLNLIRALLF